VSEESPDFYRARIREMLRRVPAKVCAAGVETTVAYKEAVVNATKHLNGARSSLTNLKQAAQRLQAYEN
jgi:uncharacterized membrane protein